MLLRAYGPTAASVVISTLGLARVRVTGPLVKSDKYIGFTTGLPLGYHAAWALFSISHHMVVWLAAERVYPGMKFKAYAGDDLVIADSKVAEQYQRIVKDLGVEISLGKSLISNSGAFEYAKRFYIKSGSVDCSPVSMKSMTLCRSTYGLLSIKRMYRVNKMSTLACAKQAYIAPIDGCWL